jgi:hypothetical protein
VACGVLSNGADTAFSGKVAVAVGARKKSCQQRSGAARERFVSEWIVGPEGLDGHRVYRE